MDSFVGKNIIAFGTQNVPNISASVSNDVVIRAKEDKNDYKAAVVESPK